MSFVPLQAAEISVTRIRRQVAAGERQDVFLPSAQSYFLMLYLADTEHADIDADGSRTPVRLYQKGSICLVDLRPGAAITLHRPLDALTFLLPCGLLREVAALSYRMAPHGLKCRRGHGDVTISNLGAALCTLLEQQAPEVALPLLQHTAIALCAHVLQHYGETDHAGLDSSRLMH